MSVQVISFNCLLKNRAGKLISSTFNRDVLNPPPNDDSALIGLAKAMQNLKKGERRTISLTAHEAYGLYDPKKVILFPKKKLPPNTKVGTMVSIYSKSGKLNVYKLLQEMDSFVCLDGNHPLADQDLVFEIEALSVRPASDEEIGASASSVGTQVLH